MHETTATRVPVSLLADLRRLVVAKHGKLIGVLGQEVEEAIKIHVAKLSKEVST